MGQRNTPKYHNKLGKARRPSIDKGVIQLPFFVGKSFSQGFAAIEEGPADIAFICERNMEARRDEIARLLKEAGTRTLVIVAPGVTPPDTFDGYLVRPVRQSSFKRRLQAGVEEAVERQAVPVYKTVPEETGKGLSVLVAEDNELNAILTRTLLERQGHKVRMVDNGAEVVEALKGEPGGYFDLVLMDLHMPEVDGFEATKRIRALGAEWSQVPVIALTANAMVEDRQACLDAGMDDYLSKPVMPEELQAALSQWAGRRSAYAAA